jgi:predicted  nucleic acid-binding Zn-ribbon protein
LIQIGNVRSDSDYCPLAPNTIGAYKSRMNAVMREKRIVSEERLARIESDVAQLRSDMNHLQADVVELKGDVREIRDDIKTINAKFADFREHVAKEFGLRSR